MSYGVPSIRRYGFYDSGDAIISQTWADKGGGALGGADPGVVGLPFIEKKELNDDCR